MDVLLVSLWQKHISVSISRVFTFFFENISDIFFYKSPWWIISSARSKKKKIWLGSTVSCRACALVFQRFELSFELLFAMASSLIYLVCFSFTVALMIEEVRSSGVFELRFDRFQNELGRDAKGHCCDGFKASSSSSSNGGRCSEACRTQFRVCLKHYQTSIDLSGTCTYGDFSTPVLGDNSLDFNSSTTTNGYTVRLPFEFSWPVSNCHLSSLCHMY